MFTDKKERIVINSKNDFVDIEEFEDIELCIETEITINKKIEMIDCNICIDTDKGGKLIVDTTKLTMEDCEIFFSGKVETPSIHIINSDVVFDGCDFSQDKPNKLDKSIFIYADAPNYAIEILDSKIRNICGSFMVTKGAGVYLENNVISDIVGNIAIVDMGMDEFQPSFVLKNCAISNCEYLESKNKDEEEDEFIANLFKPLGATLFKDENEEKENYGFSQENAELFNKYIDSFSMSAHKDKEKCLISIDKGLAVTIENNIFENCKTYCIKAIGNMRHHYKMNNCKFVDCINDVSITAIWGKYQVVVERYITDIENCEFINCNGVYVWAQMAKMNINNCSFSKCQCTHYFSGILYLGDEVYEPIMSVKDCVFSDCYVSDEDSAIIYITAGEPENNQEGTVLISGCQFNNCNAEQEIRGKEKQESKFLKKTITLCRVVD